MNRTIAAKTNSFPSSSNDNSSRSAKEAKQTKDSSISTTDNISIDKRTILLMEGRLKILQRYLLLLVLAVLQQVRQCVVIVSNVDVINEVKASATEVRDHRSIYPSDYYYYYYNLSKYLFVL
jgi:hypothetical protein